MKPCFTFALLLTLKLNLLFAQGNNIGPGVDIHLINNTSSYVDLGDVFNDIAFPITFESWIYPTAFTSPFGGIIATDNSNTGNYYGFYVRLNSVGNLIFEIGDGFGASPDNRKGKITTSSVPLNKWTHICVVANSITDISFYFNGVIQPSINTDGFSGVTNIIHNNFKATIGRFITVYDQHNYAGHLDEIRLWNTSRTPSLIRKYMCRKIPSNSSGLIGYWKMDESYTGNSINDYATPSENGTIVGNVVKTTSGAPIGDVSSYNYPLTWNATSVSLQTTTGEKFTAKNISGIPAGVHVYKVNSDPYFTGGLVNNPEYYFGVFCAESNLTAIYQAVYNYTTLTGPVTIDNESEVKLKEKKDASVTTWTIINSNPDTANNKIKKSNQQSRGDYILDVKELNKISFNPINSAKGVDVYPNPATSSIKFQVPKNVVSIIVLNLNGDIIYINKDPIPGDEAQLNISWLENGTYLLNVVTLSDVLVSKFVLQKP
jgi:hypothetical protein